MLDNFLQTALRDCYEPGPARRNVVDAGLIASAKLTVDTEAPGHGIPGVPVRHHAHLVLLAPGLDEAVNAQLMAQIENRLLGMETISAVTIDLLPPLFPIL